MRRGWVDCCAHAGADMETAAAPSALMKSRLFIDVAFGAIPRTSSIAYSQPFPRPGISFAGHRWLLGEGGGPAGGEKRAVGRHAGV